MTHVRRWQHSGKWLVVAAIGVAVSSSACRSNASRDAGSVEQIKIEVGGRTREYLLYTSQSLQRDSGKHALVIVLHGGGGTAKQIMRETGESFFRLADENGFYVLFPNAINKMWDFGAGKISSELEERVDDRSYFERILDDAVSQLPIDPGRVFATGISRGGQASYFLACEFPGRIRAIAPVAMPLPAFMADDCRSGPPVGIAIMNGTEDPLVPYDGGAITVGRKERGDVLGTNQTIALWGNRNGCDLSRHRDSTLDAARDRMLVELSEWRNCSGAAVLLYRIVGGGHTWPSGSQYLPAFLVGRATRDIDGAEVAWAFFSEFR
jgi:polyhydroxybutyrate depolymerase